MNAGAEPRRCPLDDVERIVDELLRGQRSGSPRVILGIAGPPGSGKSRLATRVTEHAAATVPSSVAPMDGFHRSNDDLRGLGLLDLKGVPESFDADGFVAKVRELREGGRTVVWPTYDRTREEVVAHGSVIGPDIRLIVVEGNYLLLDAPPWDQIRPLLHATWFLDVPEDVLVPRLRRRHESHRSPPDACAKVQSTDLPNATLVASTRDRADVIITG